MKALHVKGFTEEEIDQLHDAAAAERLSMSAWVRRVLLRRATVIAANEQRGETATERDERRATGGR